jgi:hypothetical protein
VGGGASLEVGLEYDLIKIGDNDDHTFMFCGNNECDKL